MAPSRGEAMAASPGCDGHINSSYDLKFSFQRKKIESKRQLVLSSPAGTFKDIKVNELKTELQARGSSVEGKKDELQKNYAACLEEQKGFQLFCTKVTSLLRN